MRIWSQLLKKSLMENFIFCVVYEFRKIQGYLFYFLTRNVENLWQNSLPRCSYAIPWIVLSPQRMLSSIMACDRLNPNIDCKKWGTNLYDFKKCFLCKQRANISKYSEHGCGWSLKILISKFFIRLFLLTPLKDLLNDLGKNVKPFGKLLPIAPVVLINATFFVLND